MAYLPINYIKWSLIRLINERKFLFKHFKPSSLILISIIHASRLGLETEILFHNEADILPGDKDERDLKLSPTKQNQMNMFYLLT